MDQEEIDNVIAEVLCVNVPLGLFVLISLVAAILGAEEWRVMFCVWLAGALMAIAGNLAIVLGHTFHD